LLILKKLLTIRLPHLTGSGEDEWSAREGEIYEARCAGLT